MAQGRDWTEDETRLVLELYQKTPFGKFHDANPDVIALAADIDRTPAAVAMKLSNFASLDPNITGSGRKGLDGATQLDRRVWDEFHPSEEAAGNMLPSGRVWITSFWGFDPEQDGYLGFTREGDRTEFLRQFRAGDLVMVYATMGDNARPDERGRILGFLEIERRTIRDRERMSPAGVSWKISNGMATRWTYAVPAIRAWRSVDKPLAKDIAPTTLAPGANFRLIASRGLFLRPGEAAAALSIRLRPVQPFGGYPIAPDEAAKVYTPSKGFPMSFGKRKFETKDGAHFLYALKLECDVHALLGASERDSRGKAVIKIGLAKDPKRRCSDHNDCLPPAAKMRWKVVLQSESLTDGQAALDAETAMKSYFADKYRSLGREFFLCDEKSLPGEFARAQRMHLDA